MFTSGFCVTLLVGLSAIQADAQYKTAGDPRPQDGIPALIADFSRLRNAFDGDAVANLYTEDAEYIRITGARIRGRQELSRLWGSVKGQSQRTVRSIDPISRHVALAHVLAEFDTGPPLTETFVLLWRDGRWQIAIHEAASVPQPSTR